MLLTSQELEKYTIKAIDGEIGHVEDFYFDDESWVVRYLVVDAGSWLTSHQVLVSPVFIHDANWVERTLPVSITKDQVRHSPGINIDQPVSRQNEDQYMGYYGYPNYWGDAGIWGAGM